MSDWRCSRLRPFHFLALAHAGADVALGLRDVKTGGELAREIEAIGRRVLPLQMDMTRLDQVSRAMVSSYFLYPLLHH
jgi:NAD(P)-dependent dehydrogenase (short-subunit alcohol dehydrogenase family)